MVNVGIVGFGNIGRAIYDIIAKSCDYNCVGIFSRRNVYSDIYKNILPFSSILDYKNKIDILFFCEGSFRDTEKNEKELSKNFCIIDCFDNHNVLKSFIAEVNDIAIKNGTLSFVGFGWDPGVLSLFRSYFAFLTNNSVYTFWGKGVSQGHTNALKSVDGVIDGIEYTIPNKKYKKIKIFSENKDNLKAHKRVCYVVKKKNYSKRQIVFNIKNIPFYFKGENTKVFFVKQKNFYKKYFIKYHSGEIISKQTIFNNDTILDFGVKMDNNPLFTASIMVRYSRILFEMFCNGYRGAKTILDIPISMLLDNCIEML